MRNFETNPGVFERNKNFHIKNKNFWPDENYKEINDFCFKIRDGITNIIETVNKEAPVNLSKKEFSGLQKIVDMKNESHIINDSDKNLGAVMADKTDVVKECQRQLYDINTYIRLSLEEMEILIAKIKSHLLEIVGRYKENFFCSTKEKDFLLSKISNFNIPHLYHLENIEKSNC